MKTLQRKNNSLDGLKFPLQPEVKVANQTCCVKNLIYEKKNACKAYAIVIHNLFYYSKLFG